MTAYRNMAEIEKNGDEGLASQIFDNSDFGYYKVNIERPRRLKSQFSEDRISELRFDKSLREPMEWAFEEFGNKVYSELNLLEKEILEWCEKNELNLSANNSRKLLNKNTWEKQKLILESANELMNSIGTDEYNDFNIFKKIVDEEVKTKKLKISASEKKDISQQKNLVNILNMKPILTYVTVKIFL